MKEIIITPAILQTLGYGADSKKSKLIITQFLIDVFLSSGSGLFQFRIKIWNYELFKEILVGLPQMEGSRLKLYSNPRHEHSNGPKTVGLIIKEEEVFYIKF